MPDLRVTLIACVAGNPLKAWRGGTPPNDVWEPKEVEFVDLVDAQTFVEGLPTETTTHVEIQVAEDTGWRTIFNQDAGDDLALTTLDPPPPEVEPVPDDEIPAAPPLATF